MLRITRTALFSVISVSETSASGAVGGSSESQVRAERAGGGRASSADEAALAALAQAFVPGVLTMSEAAAAAAGAASVAPAIEPVQKKKKKPAAASAAGGAASAAAPSQGPSAAEMEPVLLGLLGDSPLIEDSMQLAVEQGWDHLVLVGLLKSLESAAYVQLAQQERAMLELTEEGRECAELGSPEVRFLRSLPAEGVSLQEAKKQAIGFSTCMKNKWVQRSEDNQSVLPAPGVDTNAVEDMVQRDLQAVLAAHGDASVLSADKIKALSKRKMLRSSTPKFYAIEQGPEFSLVRKQQAAELTKEMLVNDEWKNTDFKPLNLQAMGVQPGYGYLHPTLKVRFEFRKILLSMGFEEMPTNQWVESGFWNFDSLFQPQQHPARDAHDTFFLTAPRESSLSSVPPEYVERVRQTHQTGGETGSIGYRYNWDMEEARKNVLRTHTTAVSSKMLYRLANQEGGFKPKKYFSIDRVFRNEHIDRTHLAEFHQVEGLCVFCSVCFP